MSGLSNEPRGGSSFVNFKEGQLINDGKTFTSLTGHIIDIAINADTYQNEVYQKVFLFVKDDEDKVWLLGFKMTSGYGRSFFRMCPNIDYSLPVTIGAGTDELDNGQTYGKMFISQSGKYIQHYYKKGTKEYDKVPLVKETTVGAGKNKKKVLDTSDRDVFIESVIENVYLKKVKVAHPKGADPKYHKMALKVSSDAVIPEGVANDPASDLPF